MERRMEFNRCVRVWSECDESLVGKLPNKVPYKRAMRHFIRIKNLN